MKESDWNDCLESTSSIPVSPNEQKAKSLIRVAEGRVSYLEKQNIDETTCNYILENYYTSITELIHAIAASKGYNIKNHICLGFLLRDVLQKEQLFRVFDDLRFKRNSLVYYGHTIELEIAKEAIKKAQRMIIDLGKISEVI